MTNREVLEYIRQVDDHKNSCGNEYIADKCVKAGLGQTEGGYKKDFAEIVNMEYAEPSQKTHFIYYSSSIDEEKKDSATNSPLYSRLRCPELILFIAEVAGVPRTALKAAYELLENYEQKNGLVGTGKNGNYIWGKEIFAEFKKAIKFSEVTRIITKSDKWESVRKEVAKLFSHQEMK